MKAAFSNSWKRSTQPRKQRKYRHNAPLHIRQKFIRAHLSKELREKHNKRSSSVRVGDKTKIVRGQFKGKTGKVERVDLKKSKIYISGIESVKKEGAKVQIPINPTNVIITELNLDDKKRKESMTKSAAESKSRTGPKKEREK